MTKNITYFQYNDSLAHWFNALLLMFFVIAFCSLQSLVGDVDKAMKTIHNYHQVWKQYGFTPEFYNIPKSEAHNNREGYPLRPGG